MTTYGFITEQTSNEALFYSYMKQKEAADIQNYFVSIGYRNLLMNFSLILNGSFQLIGLPARLCVCVYVRAGPSCAQEVNLPQGSSALDVVSVYPSVVKQPIVYSLQYGTSLGMCPWYQPWLRMSAALSFSSSSSSLRSFSGGDSSRYFSLENCVEQTQEKKHDISGSEEPPQAALRLHSCVNDQRSVSTQLIYSGPSRRDKELIHRFIPK